MRMGMPKMMKRKLASFGEKPIGKKLLGQLRLDLI